MKQSIGAFIKVLIRPGCPSAESSKITEAGKSTENDESSSGPESHYQDQAEDTSKSTTGTAPSSKKPKTVDDSKNQPLNDPVPKTTVQQTPARSTPLPNGDISANKEPTKLDDTPTTAASPTTSSTSTDPSQNCDDYDAEFEIGLCTFFEKGVSVNLAQLFLAAKSACQADPAVITVHDYDKELEVIVKEKYDELWKQVGDPNRMYPVVERLKVLETALQAQRGFDEKQN